MVGLGAPNGCWVGSGWLSVRVVVVGVVVVDEEEEQPKDAKSGNDVLCDSCVYSKKWSGCW